MVLFCHITSHIDGAPHANLLSEKGGTGFPTLSFMDAEGNVLSHPKERSVAAFEKTRSSLAKLMALKQKAAAGDHDAARGVFLAELDLGRYALAQARARYDELDGFTPKQKKHVAQALVNLSFKDLMGRARKQRMKLEDIGPLLVEIKNKKEVPTDDGAFQFWNVLLQYAKSSSDVALFESSLNSFKPLLGKNPRYRTYLRRMKKTLKELKKGS